MDHEQLEHSLEDVRTLILGWSRAQGLAALAQNSRPDLLVTLLEEASALKDGNVEDSFLQAWTLARIAPNLPGKQKHEVAQDALRIAQQIKNVAGRAYALRELIPSLTGKERTQVLHDCLNATQAIGEKQERLEALKALAPQLTEELTGQAIVDVYADEDYSDYELWVATTALAPRLTSERLEYVLGRLPMIQDAHRYAGVLRSLAPHLSGSLLERALNMAWAIEDKSRKLGVLTALAPKLKGESFSQILEAVMEAQDASLLSSFLPLLPDSAPLLVAIRQAMTSQLRSYSDETRDSVLQFCARGYLFKPPILSDQTIATVAAHIMEIYQEWEWF
jgi:hypothetical protein